MSSTTTDNKEPNVETLSKRYLHFLTSGEHADITLIVGKDKIAIKAHKLILMFGSSYFQQLLAKGKQELLSSNAGEAKVLNIVPEGDSCSINQTTAAETSTTDKQMEYLVIEDVEPDDFDMFLQFLYSKIPPSDISTALPLLMCAEKFSVPSLIEAAGNLLKKSLTLESALTILQQAVHFKCGDLQASALELICKWAYKILETAKFTDLSEEAVGLILKNDELRAYDEMQVFEAAIRWAHAECVRQKVNPTNGKYVRSVLELLLKFIRFPLMNASEFPSKVGRLKILTTEERVDILEAFNTPEAQRFSEFFPTTERLYYIPESRTQVVYVARNSASMLTADRPLHNESDITFKVNKPVWISRIQFSLCVLSVPPPQPPQHAFMGDYDSMYGYGAHNNSSQVSEVPLTITLKIKNSNKNDVPALKKCKEIVKVNVRQNYTGPAAAVEFESPIRVQGGIWYLITASFNAQVTQGQGQGQINYQPSTSETTQVCCHRGDDPLYFDFQITGANNNGQIAEIGYKLDE